MIELHRISEATCIRNVFTVLGTVVQTLFRFLDCFLPPLALRKANRNQTIAPHCVGKSVQR